MSLVFELAGLTAEVMKEPDLDRCLDHLAESAMDFTLSRNAMFARMNDDMGTVELTNGAGADWDKAQSRRIQIGEQEGAGIVGYVAAKGSSFVTGNVRAEPLYKDLFKTSKSEMAIPIKDMHGRTRGVLNLETDQENAYSEEDVKVCEIIADLAAFAMYRDEMERREEAFIQIGSSLDRVRNEEELIDTVLRVADQLLRFHSCSIFLYDPTSDRYMLRGSVGQLKDKVGIVGYQAGDGCTGWVCQNGQAMRINNPQSDPRWRGRVLEFPSEKIASFLAVPIMTRAKSIGAFRVVRRVSDNPFQDNRFTETDERLLTSIAEQFAIGLDSIRWVQRAIRVERMAAWGELSAKSSHMIGNRVFAIKGDVNELGHLLDENPVQIGEIAKLQKSLASNVTRVEEILQEFRDFVTATQLTIKESDLNTLVQEAVTEVFPRRSEIQLEFELDPDLPPVHVDGRKVQRAVSEIVENALSFFEKGHLRISTSIAEDFQVQRCNLPITNEYAMIRIEDEGPGVDPDRKQVIFQPFYSSRVKGMGLGLSIVKGIVDAHGGAVLEEGEEGEGAKFVILLPIGERPKA